MKSVRSGNIDEINVGIVDENFPIVSYAIKTDFFFGNLRGRGVIIGNHFKNGHAIFRTEEHLLVKHCAGVRLTHPTCADKTDTNFFHFSDLPKIFICLCWRKYKISGVESHFNDFPNPVQNLSIRLTDAF